MSILRNFGGFGLSSKIQELKTCTQFIPFTSAEKKKEYLVKEKQLFKSEGQNTNLKEAAKQSRNGKGNVGHQIKSIINSCSEIINLYLKMKGYCRTINDVLKQR